jgi:hypothetical protein
MHGDLVFLSGGLQANRMLALKEPWKRKFFCVHDEVCTSPAPDYKSTTTHRRMTTVLGLSAEPP